MDLSYGIIIGSSSRDINMNPNTYIYMLNMFIHLFIYVLQGCMCVYIWFVITIMNVWRSEYSLVELVLSFYKVERIKLK